MDDDSRRFGSLTEDDAVRVRFSEECVPWLIDRIRCRRCRAWQSSGFWSPIVSCVVGSSVDRRKASGCQGWTLKAVGRLLSVCVCILEPPLSAMYFWVEVESQACKSCRTGTIEERRCERGEGFGFLLAGRPRLATCVQSVNNTSSVAGEKMRCKFT